MEDKKLEKDLQCSLESRRTASGTDITDALEQDKYEMEFFCGMEGDLSALKQKCVKNPNHEGFFSIKDFDIKHLPEQYQDKALVDFIHVHADLTVKIVVDCTSWDRPDGYACHRLRGRNVKRYGSGWIKSAYRFTTEEKHTCPCVECAQSDSPRTEWIHLEVFTATHVVYNNEEAVRAVCEIDYNSEDDYRLGLVKKVQGWKVWGRTVDTDRCHVSFVTHDLQLGDEIIKFDRRRMELQEYLQEQYWSPRDVHKLTVIISHPHGCCKQVSIGEWTEREEIDREWTRFTYNTPTCPGSSGALAYFLGMRLKRGLLHSGHPHSGQKEAGGLNQSGVGIF